MGQKLVYYNYESKQKFCVFVCKINKNSLLGSFELRMTFDCPVRQCAPKEYFRKKAFSSLEGKCAYKYRNNNLKKKRIGVREARTLDLRITQKL